jgi:hypothetical protein
MDNQSFLGLGLLSDDFVVGVLDFVFVVYLTLASFRVCFHSPHPLLPSLLHLVYRVEYRLLLLAVNTLFILLNILKNLFLIISEFSLQLFHLLFQLSILAHRNMI